MYKIILFRKTHRDISYILISGETPSAIWRTWEDVCLRGEYDLNYSVYGANFPAFSTIFHADARARRNELLVSDLQNLSFSVCDTFYRVEHVSEDLSECVEKICETIPNNRKYDIDNTTLLRDVTEDLQKGDDWLRAHPAVLVKHETAPDESPV